MVYENSVGVYLSYPNNVTLRLKQPVSTYFKDVFIYLQSTYKLTGAGADGEGERISGRFSTEYGA